MEGIIKYQAIWTDKSPISESEFEKINSFRSLAVKRSYMGIGADGIGYGNISYRLDSNNQFIISSSATGGISIADRGDYSKVIDFDISNNKIYCKGNKIASSESLTHAAIYQSNPEIKAVLHIHNEELWQKHLFQLPTTSEDIEYGSVAMAEAIAELIKTYSDNKGAFVMGGHREGIIAFGESLQDCIEILEGL